MPSASITALDIDRTALGRVRFAKEKLELDNLTVHEGKIDSLEKKEFDLIYSVDVFEHIPVNEMPFAAMKIGQGNFAGDAPQNENWIKVAWLV